MSIGDFLDAANCAAAFLAALAAGLVGYGFVRLAFRKSSLVGHLATGLLLLHAAVFLRTIYWDALRNLVSEAAWDAWYEMSGETSVNLLFNGMVIAAGYHSLKALRLAIPEEVRGEYSLVGSAFYPRRRPLQRAAGALLERLGGRWR